MVPTSWQRPGPIRLASDNWAAEHLGLEAIDGLAKRIKRVAFGLRNFVHWRIRVLLYAGKADWSKLATITPAAPGTSEGPVCASTPRRRPGVAVGR